MAKSKTVRIDDTERCINFRMGSTSQNNGAIHISAGLSAANRRLYKQLRCYRAKVEILRHTPSDTLYVYKFYSLSNAWWVKQAIKLAKQTWLDHSKEERAALAKSSKGRAKYFDFVIEVGKNAADADFLQFDHDYAVQELVFDENLLEAQKYYLTRREGADGDVEAFADTDTVGFTVDATAEGSTSTTYNIFDEYIKNLNIDPDTDTREGAYSQLEGTDEISQDALQTYGDEPPWDADAFPAPWVLRHVLKSEGNVGEMLSTQFMDCPLGVIMVQKVDGSDSAANFDDDDEFCLMMAKGKYRGIHAPSY